MSKERKTIIALRGSFRREDVNELNSAGYDVIWCDDLKGIRQIESTSLRDYFAAAALQGMMAYHGIYQEDKESHAPYSLDNLTAAEAAYNYADSMLAERDK